MSEAQKGDKNHMFGLPKSDETKQKMREAKQGEKNHMYGITGEKHHNTKRVYRYTLSGTFIDSFGSAEEAARYIKKNGDSTNIRQCARGARKTAYKFKWSYIKC